LQYSEWCFWRPVILCAIETYARVLSHQQRRVENLGNTSELNVALLE